SVYQYGAWWYLVFPSLALLITTLAFNIFGDGVRDAFDPRGDQLFVYEPSCGKISDPPHPPGHPGHVAVNPRGLSDLPRRPRPGGGAHRDGRQLGPAAGCGGGD